MADKGDSGGDGWTKVGAKKEGLASEAAAPPSAASPLDLEAYAAMYDLDRRAVSRLRTAPADMREAIIANSFEGIRNRSAWVLTTLALMHRLGAPRFDDARVEAAIADNDIGATSTWIFRAAPKDSQAKILAANFERIRKKDGFIVSTVKADVEADGGAAAPEPEPPAPLDRNANWRRGPEAPAGRGPVPLVSSRAAQLKAATAPHRNTSGRPVAPAAPPAAYRPAGRRDLLLETAMAMERVGLSATITDAPESAAAPVAPAAPPAAAAPVAPEAPPGFVPEAAAAPAAPPPPPAWLLEEDPTARFASFLAALGMARYLIRFADEEIHCIEDLAFLTVADLEDVGIPPADAPRLHARVAETAAMIS